MRRTPNLFLPVFLVPPSPQYLSLGVCSRNIRLPVDKSFSKSSLFCSNLARRPISMIPSFIYGQLSGLYIFNLRPRDLAFFGSTAAITSSYYGFPTNFLDWKKCSFVGQIFPSILNGEGQKLLRNSYSRFVFPKKRIGSSKFSGCIYTKYYFFYQQKNVFNNKTYKTQMGNDFCHQCIEPDQDTEFDTIFLRNCFYESQLVQQLSESIDRATILQSLKKIGQYCIPSSRRGIIYHPSWGYYEGEINQAKKAEGKGRLIQINLFLYKGQFKGGKFHGEGLLYDKFSQTKFSGTWFQDIPVSGELSNQIIKGRPTYIESIVVKSNKILSAVVKFPNKNLYEGELVLKNNCLVVEGKGKMLFPDGSEYDGQWTSGRMQGKGKYTWENGDYYEGQYENNNKCGPGTMYWKKQNKIFEGHWQGGQPIGTSFISLQNEESLDSLDNYELRSQSQNISGQ